MNKQRSKLVAGHIAIFLLSQGQYLVLGKGDGDCKKNCDPPDVISTVQLEPLTTKPIESPTTRATTLFQHTTKQHMTSTYSKDTTTRGLVTEDFTDYTGEYSSEYNGDDTGTSEQDSMKLVSQSSRQWATVTRAQSKTLLKKIASSTISWLSGSQTTSFERTAAPIERMPTMSSPPLFEVTTTEGTTWGEWGQWSACSATCWTTATRSRSRGCYVNDIMVSCPGSTESEVCSWLPVCTSALGWSEWSEWSSCSASCYPGTRRRHRQCAPAAGGSGCGTGTVEEVGTCGEECEQVIELYEGITCPTPPQIPYAKVTSQGRSVGAQVLYTCVAGLNFTDGENIHRKSCSEKGIWKPQETPSCAARACTFLKDAYVHVENILIDLWKPNVTHSVASISCTMDTTNVQNGQTRSAICDTTQGLAHQLMHCSSAVCLLPKQISGVNYTGDMMMFSAGSDTKLVCSENKLFYTGMSFKKVRCTSQGWSDNLGQCKSGRCHPPPYVENTRADRVSDLQVVLHCLPGTRFPDGLTNRTYFCYDEQWLPEDFRPCLLTTCPALPMLKEANLNTTLSVYNTAVNVTCNFGYVISDMISRWLVIICLETGHWSRNVTACNEVICPEPENVTNAFRVGNQVRFIEGASVDFRCYRGYRLQDGWREGTINCLITGNWSTIGDSCEVDRCPPPPTVSNGTPMPYVVDIGMTVTYQCNYGYKNQMDENISALCLESKTWTTPSGLCKPLQCPEMNNTRFTRLSNRIYEATCEDGFTFPGNERFIYMKCTESGEWNITENSMCYRNRCPDPNEMSPRPDNVENIYFPDDRVEYICREGFWLSEIRNPKLIMTCMPSGHWDYNPDNCTVISCPMLPVWDNLVIDNNSTVFNSQINAFCAKGFRFKPHIRGGVIRIKCSSDGYWKPVLPDCVDIDGDRLMVSVTEAENAGKVSILVCAFVGILFGVLVLLDIATHVCGPKGTQRQKVNKKSNKLKLK